MLQQLPEGILGSGQHYTRFVKNCLLFMRCELPALLAASYCYSMRWHRKGPLTAFLCRAPMTKPSPPASAAPSTSLSEEEGSARSSYSRWTSASRGKKRKCDKPLRSYVC